MVISIPEQLIFLRFECDFWRLDKQIQDYDLTLAAHQQLLEDHSKTKQDLQELKEAKIHYQEKLQKQRAYYEKKNRGPELHAGGEAKAEAAEGRRMPKPASQAEVLVEAAKKRRTWNAKSCRKS